MSQESQGPEMGDSLPQIRSVLLIALGSNLPSEAGGPRETLRLSVKRLTQAGAVIRATSNYYSTPAFPAGAGPDYVNAAIKVDCDWTPEEALEVLHRIEAEFGRARVQRWGRRTLDMDLIAVDDLVVPDARTHQTWRDLPLAQQL